MSTEVKKQKEDAKKQKIIESIGIARGKVKCTWAVWRRIFMLLRLGNEQNLQFILLWVLALSVLALYTWVYYLSSLNSGNFLTLITDYSATSSNDNNNDNDTSTDTFDSLSFNVVRTPIFTTTAKMFHYYSTAFFTTNTTSTFTSTSFFTSNTINETTNTETEAYNNFETAFYITLWQVLLETIAASFVYSFMLLLGHKIGLIWRERITKACFKEYFTGNTFYEINNFEKDLDNVDVRLSTDVRLFTINMADYIFGTMYYNGVLPTITLTISFTILLVESGATMGIIIAYVTFIFFSILNVIIGSYVGTATYKNNTSSAYYLFEHQHLRNHSEHVAFYKGQEEEKRVLLEQFEQAQKTSNSVVNRMLWLNFCVNCYYYLATIFSYALPGLIFIQWTKDHSAKEAAALVAATAYNSYLQLNFSYAILLSEVNTAVMNYGLRVGELYERLVQRAEKSRISNNKLSAAPACAYAYNSPFLKIQNVDCKTPSGKLLLSNLNLEAKKDQNIIIMGASGSGKSSILRIICGLWPIENNNLGKISLPCSPDKGGIFFLPQKPYLTLGTLREQFFYPGIPNDNKATITITTNGSGDSSTSISSDASNNTPSNTSNDKIILDLLREVNMEYILDRYSLDTVADWAVTLSVGEAQRIGMARLFFQRPSFAILDESTAAVDAEMESKFYLRCKELGLHYISVAHRQSVIRYHDVLLKLGPDNTYEVIDLSRETKSNFL